MRKIESKKGQLTLGDAPTVVLLVGLVFLVMATIAFIGQKNQSSMTVDSTAYNVSRDLQKEIGNNTSIAGIVLTIALVGIVLSILIGVFMGVRGAGSRV
jgi:hypothetical protein